MMNKNTTKWNRNSYNVWLFNIMVTIYILEIDENYLHNLF